MPRSSCALAVGLSLGLGGCTQPPRPVASPSPSPASRPATKPAEQPPVAKPEPPRQPSGPPALPPIPRVEGSLVINVVYPQPRHLIESRDSSFLLGSVGNGNATLLVDGTPARVYPNGAFVAWVANPPASAPRYQLVAALGADTVRATQEVRVRANRPEIDEPKVETVTGWVRVANPHATLPDTDDLLPARPEPSKTYHWFLLPGTVLERTARISGYTRVKLDEALQVWVPDSIVHPLTGGSHPADRTAGNARVESAARWADLVIPMAERPAYFVEQRAHEIDLTLYGARGNTDLVSYSTNDTLIRNVTWEQVTDDRLRYSIQLSAAPLGYLVLWERGRLIFRVRRPPVVDPTKPLRGIVIAVDPGHPPEGSQGPTGLREPEGTLAVGERLRTLLEARGARVVMTRSTVDSVPLYDRPVIARRADADAFVSIHLNAYPDGTNPLTASPGTGTYYFQPQSEPLARAVQRGMTAALGLRDEGVFFRSLAVVRQTWMPAVLCEGAFVIMPEQEAALRTPEFQESYARGVADGLEAYFRTRGWERVQ